MRKNVENILISIVVASVIVAALGLILSTKAMTTVRGLRRTATAMLATTLFVSTSVRYFIHSISLTSPPYPPKSYLLLAHVLVV